MPGSEPGAVAAGPRPYRSFASTMRSEYLMLQTHAPGLFRSSVASVLGCEPDLETPYTVGIKFP